MANESIVSIGTPYVGTAIAKGSEPDRRNCVATICFATQVDPPQFLNIHLTEEGLRGLKANIETALYSIEVIRGEH